MDTIEKCFDYLKLNEIDPTIIIAPSKYSYSDENFLNDHDFRRKFEFPDRSEDKYFLGTYKDVEIYMPHSDYINNKIVLADF